MWSIVRLILYFIGTVALGGIAIQMFKLSSNTARTFGAITFSFCLNFAFWAVALLISNVSGYTIPCFDILSTIAVGIVTVAAVVFLVRFPNGRPSD